MAMCMVFLLLHLCFGSKHIPRTIKCMARQDMSENLFNCFLTQTKHRQAFTFINDRFVPKTFPSQLDNVSRHFLIKYEDWVPTEIENSAPVFSDQVLLPEVCYAKVVRGICQILRQKNDPRKNLAMNLIVDRNEVKSTLKALRYYISETEYRILDFYGQEH